MKRSGKFLSAMAAILLILGSILVNAQVEDKFNENSLVSQQKLKIKLHESNKTFSSDGEEAKMYIVVENRTYPDQLERARSDINVLLMLGSEIGDLSSHEVKIPQGREKSEDISLTSTQPGTVIVIAEAVNFEKTNVNILFETPTPSELDISANPKEKILANNNATTTLSVYLLKANEEPFKPRSDIKILLWSDRGDTLEPITISKDKHYGTTNFKTDHDGDFNITANSSVYRLDSIPIKVSFIPAVTLPTVFIAFIGGLLIGIPLYYLWKFFKPQNGSNTKTPQGTQNGSNTECGIDQM